MSNPGLSMEINFKALLSVKPRLGKETVRLPMEGHGDELKGLAAM